MSTIKTTYIQHKDRTGTANITLAADGTATFFSAVGLGLPTGCIVMWSGAIADIPTGYVLCNGANSTPDLRDRFIIGAHSDDSGTAKTNVTTALTQTGGDKDAVNVEHSHDTYGSESGYRHAVRHGGDAAIDWISQYANSNDATYKTDSRTDTAGVSGTDKNLPPYYALAYIMKT